MSGSEKLGLFCGEDKPDTRKVWTMYEKCKEFNNAINLNETIQKNENFYISKQWEGVKANGLPTPQYNIFKRTVGFIVATITSDNIKVNASVQAATVNTKELIEPARIVNEEFDVIMERLSIPSMVRELCRNAAVDGDGCIYTYWDDKAETGQAVKGAIASEIIENDRVFFGNPNDRRVQAQPYIIISRRLIVRNAKLKAKRNGISTWEQIKCDDEEFTSDSVKRTDDKVTELLILWRDDDSGNIWAYECTNDSATKEAWDTGLRLYPVVWFNWDKVRDSYHGQAMLTGLIPNQEFINKAWAMSQLSLMTLAFPRTIYDKTRIAHLDNRVGSAIGVNGGNMNDVIKIIDPPAISPQISQFIIQAEEQTEKLLGATSVAMGDTRPDNTSAIIALQRAAATPTELTKQELYRSVEELFRIYLDFMSEYYGTRYVDITAPDELKEAAQFAGAEMADEIPVAFDFSILKDHPMKIKLDVGASSYYSEIASAQTLDNLLMQGKITTVQYLERISDDRIPARRALIADIKRSEAMAMPPMMQSPMAQMEGSAMPQEKEEVKGGGGYGTLQRKINQSGTAEGIV